MSLLRSLAGFVKEGFTAVNHSSGLVLGDITQEWVVKRGLWKQAVTGLCLAWRCVLRKLRLLFSFPFPDLRVLQASSFVFIS